MENATRAFVMAAEILIGVLILSIAVYLFSVFGKYSEEAYIKVEKNQITEFNNQFLKYNGVKCTIHDIISLANLAKQNNIQNQVEVENMYYIQIDIGTTTNIEKLTEQKKIEFIKKYSNNNYKCTQYIINDDTNKICYMKFAKY